MTNGPRITVGRSRMCSRTWQSRNSTVHIIRAITQSQDQRRGDAAHRTITP